MSRTDHGLGDKCHIILRTKTRDIRFKLVGRTQPEIGFIFFAALLTVCIAGRDMADFNQQWWKLRASPFIAANGQLSNCYPVIAFAARDNFRPLGLSWKKTSVGNVHRIKLRFDRFDHITVAMAQIKMPPHRPFSRIIAGHFHQSIARHPRSNQLAVTFWNGAKKRDPLFNPPKQSGSRSHLSRI